MNLEWTKNKSNPKKNNLELLQLWVKKSTQPKKTMSTIQKIIQTMSKILSSLFLEQIKVVQNSTSTLTPKFEHNRVNQRRQCNCMIVFE